MIQPKENRNRSESREHPQTARDAEGRSAISGKRSRLGMRFGLQELLLVTVFCAVWLWVVIASRQIAKLESDIQMLEPMTSRLIILDQRQLNVRAVPSIWNSIDSWKCYVPRNADVELRFASEGLNASRLPSTYQAVSLPEGEHRIHLKVTDDAEGYRREVYIDNELVLQKHHVPEWLESVGSMTERDVTDQSAAYPTSEPLRLHDERYGTRLPNGTYASTGVPEHYDYKGNLLWISPRLDKPESASTFISSENQLDFGHEVVGHRQGIRVQMNRQDVAAGRIAIEPSRVSVFGDRENRFCCRVAVSVRPILKNGSEGEIPEAQENPRVLGQLGMPISYHDTMNAPGPSVDPQGDQRVTKNSISEDGEEMRVFAHYPRYASGAQPIVEILFDANDPNRIGFRPHAAPGSAPMQACEFVTQFGASFYWREFELFPSLKADAVEPSGKLSTVKLTQLYPQLALSVTGETSPSEAVPLTWKNIPLTRLPRVKRNGTLDGMLKLSLITDVAEPFKLKYPAGLTSCMQYQGVANRQVWWVPADDGMADDQTAVPVKIEVRAASVYSGTEIPIVGGPAVENVRITVPMPAAEPIWLAIVPESQAESKGRDR